MLLNVCGTRWSEMGGWWRERGQGEGEGSGKRCWGCNVRRGMESEKWHFLVLDTAEGWTTSMFLTPNGRQVISTNVNDHKCWYIRPSGIFCCGKDNCTCQRLKGFELFGSPSEKSKRWLAFLSTNTFFPWQDKSWWRRNNLRLPDGLSSED